MSTKLLTKKSIKSWNIAIVGLGNQAWSDYIPCLKNMGCAIHMYDVRKISRRLSKDSGKINLICRADEIPVNNLDLAIITTPHSTHYQYTKYFLERGIKVLTEKPLTTSLEEAKMLRKYSNLFVSLKRRYYPSYKDASDCVCSGEIGLPTSYTYKYLLGLNNPANGWRLNEKISGGGCLIDMGYHVIDMIGKMFGKPNSVFASTNNFQSSSSSKIENDIHLTLSHEEVTGTVFISRSGMPKTEELMIFGKLGAIAVSPTKVTVYNADSTVRTTTTYDNSNVVAKMLLDVLSNKSKLGSVSEQIRNMEMINQAYRSLAKSSVICDEKS